ncbi:MAG TPA: hypothetical protein VMV72_06485 [Verrucomicrobiae bacterium]|nr:hypothetical protein [Verrucomicrobiae bacterium]
MKRRILLVAAVISISFLSVFHCKAQQTGVLFIAHGARYVGEVKNGKPDGRGVAKYEDGWKYEGDFKDGKESGQGELTSPDGRKYTGGFEHGAPNGHGTESWKNGQFYTGDFRDGTLEGQGTLRYADGRLYTGQFHLSVNDGMGKMTYPSGQVVEEGFWKKGWFVGTSTTATNAPSNALSPVLQPTRVTATVMRMYSTTDGSAMFRAYVVSWSNQEVVVTDPGTAPLYHEGQKVSVFMQRRSVGNGQETLDFSLDLGLLPVPSDSSGARSIDFNSPPSPSGSPGLRRIPFRR